MVNEKHLAESLLENGLTEVIHPRRALSLLMRYFKAEGKTVDAAEEACVDWMYKYNIPMGEYFDTIMMQAWQDDPPIVDCDEILISDADLATIRSRFMAMSVRKTALACLCYAKCSANKFGVFSFPVAEVSEWVGVSRQYMHRRILPLLLDFKYIKALDWVQKRRLSKRGKAAIFGVSQYKIGVPFAMEGEHKFDGIHLDEFSERFLQDNPPI